MNGLDLGMIAMIALAGSAGHCVGMCGGFVVAYSSAKIDPSSSKISQFIRHLNYNAGRVSAYTLMGALFGSLGMLFTASMEFHGTLLIVAGAFMVLLFMLTEFNVFGLTTPSIKLLL